MLHHQVASVWLLGTSAAGTCASRGLLPDLSTPGAPRAVAGGDSARARAKPVWSPRAGTPVPRRAGPGARAEPGRRGPPRRERARPGARATGWGRAAPTRPTSAGPPGGATGPRSCASGRSRGPACGRIARAHGRPSAACRRSPSGHGSREPLRPVAADVDQCELAPGVLRGAAAGHDGEPAVEYEHPVAPPQAATGREPVQPLAHPLGPPVGLGERPRTLVAQKPPSGLHHWKTLSTGDPFQRGSFSDRPHEQEGKPYATQCRAVPAAVTRRGGRGAE